MQFRDEGYIIGNRRYGENSLIVHIISKNNGLISGFIKSGGSKKNIGVCQIGNKVFFDAYARIEENMLSLKIELISPIAVNFMFSAPKLAAVS